MLSARNTPADVPDPAAWHSPDLSLLDRLREDVGTVLDRDPSVHDALEALLHPSLAAVWSHRVAHRWSLRGRRRRARAMMLVGKWLSQGVEIHPEAVIGRRFFIDHGAGTVIGGTCVIGDDVTVFHGVTLGALGWWKDNRRPSGSRRHPSVNDGVVVGANATVLGPVVVGRNAVVGAHTLVMDDVPASHHVTAGPVTPHPRRIRTLRAVTEERPDRPVAGPPPRAAARASSGVGR